jgi:hypothetical protein
MPMTKTAANLIEKLKQEVDRQKNAKEITEQQFWDALRKIGEVEEELL